MFAIRQNQYSALENRAREEFTARMETHLLTHFAHIHGEKDRFGLRDYINRNWQFATGYGLTSELAVCSYLEAASSLGEDFHTSSPFARNLLAQDLQEDVKLDDLNHHVLAETHPAEPT